jgi:hypothetical protein
MFTTAMESLKSNQNRLSFTNPSLQSNLFKQNKTHVIKLKKSQVFTFDEFSMAYSPQENLDSPKSNSKNHKTSNIFNSTILTEQSLLQKNETHVIKLRKSQVLNYDELSMAFSPQKKGYSKLKEMPSVVLSMIRNNYRKIYQVEPGKKEEYLQRYEMLIVDTKSTNVYTRHFIMVDLYRQLIWCMIVALFDSPMLQMLFFCLIDAM